MVDAFDLRSNIPLKGCAGSSPAPGTKMLEKMRSIFDLHFAVGVGLEGSYGYALSRACRMSVARRRCERQ